MRDSDVVRRLGSLGRRMAMVSVVVGLGACSEPRPRGETAETQAPPPDEELPMAQPARDPSLKWPANPDNAKPPAAPERVVGIIEYVAVDSTRKSLEAYLGETLFLVTDTGRLVLRPTAAISEEALRAQVGKKVELLVRFTEGTLPDPNESYPMDGDAPMRRGRGYQVLELVVAAP